MAHILVVDDSEVERDIVATLLQRVSGWTTAEVKSAQDALDVIQQNLPDLVITDLMIPDIDGMELVARIRAAYPGLPVILMTGHGREEFVVQALHKGTASYVPKRALDDDLVSTVTTVLDITHADREEQHIQQYLTETESHFVLKNDPALIQPFVGHLQKMLARVYLCDNTTLMQMNIALGEALTIAIYHGNLELDSSLRHPNNAAYQRHARERQSLPPYRDRSIYITARVSREEAMYVIRDEGQGFDPSAVADPTDPENLDNSAAAGCY